MVVNWPGKLRGLLYLKLASLLSVQVFVTYYGVNYITRNRSNVHDFYFDWEPAIPLVPAAAWAYLSIFILMLLPVFYLNCQQMRLLARQMAFAMFIAGVVFLIFPCRVGYPPVSDLPTGIWLIKNIELPHTIFPSLHVALSSIIMLHLHRPFSPNGRLLLVAWLIALIASVMLTHQHHLADVLGGLVLAWLCHRFTRREISGARDRQST